MTHRYGYFIVICIEDWDNLTIGKEYKVGIYDIIEQGSVSEMYIVTNDLGYDEGIYSNVFKLYLRIILDIIEIIKLMKF